MNSKALRYPCGKFREIKESSVSLKNIEKIRDNLKNYSTELQNSLSEKDSLSEKEIEEVKNLNRILQNKEKYYADRKISKKAIEKNLSKVEEFDKIIKLMKEKNIKNYNPTEFIDISEVDEVK